MKLNNLRNEIDVLDKQIAKLLNERFILIEKVKKVKTQNTFKIEDKQREFDIITNNLKYINSNFKEHFKTVYETIFKVSKDIQKL